MLVTRSGLVSLLIPVALAIPACRRDIAVPDSPPATAESPTNAPATERVVGPLSATDAEALATMNDRIKGYMAVHQKLERTLPAVPKDATPEQIDQNQRALEKLVRENRATAKPGDIFTPDGAAGDQAPACHGLRGSRRQAVEGVDHGRESRGDQARRQRPVPRHRPALDRATGGASDTAEVARGAAVPVRRKSAHHP